jgi:hypothetical protein
MAVRIVELTNNRLVVACEGEASAAARMTAGPMSLWRLTSATCTFIFAFIRSAMKRCVSAAIMRSFSATRNQLFKSFQSGRPTGTVMQLSDIGRCTAASTAKSSADAFWAKAVAKASSGSQIKPLLSGASFGAWGWGSTR